MHAAVTDLGILPDDPDRLAHALGDAGSNHDLVLTSGGVSTGEADHVRNAVEQVGKLVFWRVGIKPGRPVAMGVLPGGAAFAGLPGNPVAVFVTFVKVVRPLMRRLSGARAETLLALPVRLGFAYKKKSGRREYVRVSLRRGTDGEVEAVKHPQDGAGVITSLTQTDGVLELTEDVTELKPGDRAGFLSYAILMS
jgi:molybdopterin molybdotransferase